MTYLKRYWLIFFLLEILLFAPFSSFGQCIAPPAAGGCEGCSELLPTNINSGQTVCFSGNEKNGNINLNGGTLRICGVLTMSNFNFRSGELFIEAGGSLTINGGGGLNLNGNCLISNRGTLTVDKDITLQNSNNFIFNVGKDAVLTIEDGREGKIHELILASSNSFFVNQGVTNVEKLRVQSQAPDGAVCLGAGATLNIIDLQVDEDKQFVAPEGPSLLSFSGNAQLNKALTEDSDVYVCQEPGATTSGAGSFGAATLSCTVGTFPVEWLEFNGTWSSDQQSIGLTWTTATETNNAAFFIEQYSNSQEWQTIGSLPGAGNSTEYRTYQQKVPAQPGRIYQFRIRQQDLDGGSSYSKVLMVHTRVDLIWQAFPNPCNDQLSLEQDGLRQIYLLNSMGQRIRQISTNKPLTQIAMAGLPEGLYWLHGIDETGMVHTKKIIKQ